MINGPTLSEIRSNQSYQTLLSILLSTRACIIPLLIAPTQNFCHVLHMAVSLHSSSYIGQHSCLSGVRCPGMFLAIVYMRFTRRQCGEVIPSPNASSYT